MKQNILQRFSATVLLLAFCAISWAYDFKANGIYYDINDDGVSVTVTYKTTSYNSYSGSISIPSQVIYNSTTYNVTGISIYAFRYCSELTSVTIPNSVISIGSFAFSDCNSLTKAEFSSVESLCKIEFNSSTSNPLYYAKHLYINGQEITDMTIPNSVTSIGDYTFSGYSGLTSVNIPNSITSIGEYAFLNCSGLTTIAIPNSVTNIGNHAFKNCYGLISVTIPNSVTSIGKEVFEDCKGLTSVTIPESVTIIGGSAFYNCTNLTSVTLNTNEVVSKTYTSNNNFATIFGSQVTEYILGDKVKSIGSYSFYNCKSMKSITIPNSVTNIGNEAFSNCSNLESVICGTGLLSIGSNIFNGHSPAKVIWLTNTPPSGYSSAAGNINYVANDQYTSLSNKKVYPFLSSMFEVGGVKYVPVSPSERTCDAIDCLYNAGAENVIIGDKVSYKGINMSVGSVNDYTFYRNTHIIELNLNCNGYIGNNSFYGCISLANVNLGESITSIGNYAFSDCSSLENIVIPDAVTSLGSCSFQNCSNLKSIEMGSGVKTILTYAFANCTALPVIIIPKSVTSISNYVFRGCNSLRTVIMDEQKSELSLGSNGNSPLFSSCPLDSVYIGRNIIYQTSSNYGYSPFYRNTSLRSIEITDGETEISDNEFYGCTNLQNVKIGNGVTKIGKWAFSGCSSIDYFSFGSSVEEIGQEAFSDCTAMTRLISHASTPPTCGSQALDDINKWECTLSVPSGCIGYYQQANQWKEFFFVDDDADAPVYLVGDANGNGEVEIGDVTSVLTLMATPEATSYDNKAADANGNGVIEIGDVTTILTIMAGGN